MNLCTISASYAKKWRTEHSIHSGVFLSYALAFTVTRHKCASLRQNSSPIITKETDFIYLWTRNIDIMQAVCTTTVEANALRAINRIKKHRNRIAVAIIIFINV